MAFTFSDAAALGIILEGIFYGAYIFLFILYLVLQHRKNHGLGGLPTLAQILLFGLCTISLSLDVPVYYFVTVPDMINWDVAVKLDVSSLAISALINYLAQMILLYRCWIIWDRRWMVVAAPGFLALVSLGGGLALTSLDNINSPLWSIDQERIVHLTELTAAITYSTSLAVNALTTSLIMAKILVTSWEACPASGSGSHRSYHIVTAMLIESGFLTFAFQLAFVILFSFRPPALEIVASTITQIYGITPTLLNIRVVTGSAYDKTAGETHYLRLAHSGGATAQTTSPSVGAARVQSWDTDSKPDEYVGDLNDLREENQRLKEENDRLRLRKPY